MEEEKPKMDIKIGGASVVSNQEKLSTISLILWGSSGVGKTTLASTMPGKKLWLQFESGGTDCLGDRKDIDVVDYASQNPQSTITHFTTDQFGNLGNALAGYDSVVVDSVTGFGEMALKAAISKVKEATMENPGMRGWGYRNRYVDFFMEQVLRICAKEGKNLCVICHQDQPQKDETTGRLIIGPLVGGKLPSVAAARYSEVWRLEDNGTKQIIYIRQNPMMLPMKTRIFDNRNAEKFQWNYDAITQKGDTIEKWFDDWKKGGKKKIPVPK